MRLSLRSRIDEILRLSLRMTKGGEIASALRASQRWGSSASQ